MMNQGKEQKVDSLKTGKSYTRLFIKKREASKKIKRPKEHRYASEIKHIRYCE